MSRQVGRIYQTGDVRFDIILRSIADRLDAIEGIRPELDPGFFYLGSSKNIDTRNISYAWNTVKVSANYTVLDTDEYLHLEVTTGASNITITLPTLADNADRVLFVTKIDSGAGTVIVDGEDTETINGDTTLVILFQYSNAQIKAGTDEWRVI